VRPWFCGLMLAGATGFAWPAQQAATQAAQQGLPRFPSPSPATIALPLARRPRPGGPGAIAEAAGTTASVMMIVAHPDDEDGALLTYLSRGLARAPRC
jgi:hypothetical protein